MAMAVRRADKRRVPKSQTLGELGLRQAREAFEPSWNRWNAVRTACATLATVLWLVLLRV